MIQDFSNISILVSFILVILLFLGIDAFSYVLVKKLRGVLLCILCEVLFIIFWLFKLDFACITSAIILTVCFLGNIFCNISDFRLLFNAVPNGKTLLGRLRREKNPHPELIFDRSEMYHKVENAVLTLSRQKIGALITFETNDDLTELMKNGTVINAPVTSELLQTIFYPGTRLHDGACVVRGDKILAASVYFTPTNRPLTGKFGSRHRAAYGICETTDSVTIIVSEETGRISIAFDGELTPVTPDSFLRIFSEDMATAMNRKSQEESE